MVGSGGGNDHRKDCWGDWVVQSVNHPTLAQVMISQLVSSSPAKLCADGLEPGGCFGFCISLSHSCSVSLSFSKINIKKTQIPSLKQKEKKEKT